MQDVGGAYAGPFNEGEELKLLCEVHGGNNLSPTNCSLSHKYYLLCCRAAAPPGLLVCWWPGGAGPHPHWAGQGRGGQQTPILDVSHRVIGQDHQPIRGCILVSNVQQRRCKTPCEFSLSIGRTIFLLPCCDDWCSSVSRVTLGIVTDISSGLHCFAVYLCPCNNNCFFVSPAENYAAIQNLYTWQRILSDSVKNAIYGPSSFWNPRKLILISYQNDFGIRSEYWIPATSDLSLIGHRWSQNVYSVLFIYFQFSIEVGKYWNIISTAFVSTSIFFIQN